MTYNRNAKTSMRSTYSRNTRTGMIQTEAWMRISALTPEETIEQDLKERLLHKMQNIFPSQTEEWFVSI